jgi:MFS transporter, ACS family, tartrate transporter
MQPPESVNASGSSPQDNRQFRKITRRLIPFLFALYIAAYLDRVNVGFAALQMNRDLRFSAQQFGFGSGIFFVSYCLFEVPSNLLLARLGARRWIARIMITWGLIAAATMFVRTPRGFYALRFLLGLAEAGFFPGIAYYLSQWYPQAERARAIALFMAAVPISLVIGGPLSGALLGLDGRGGLAGWQWLYLAEGLPAVALGALVLACMTERPRDAAWLTDAEKARIEGELALEQHALAASHTVGVRRVLADPRLWRLGILNMLTVSGFYGYSVWSPMLIQRLTGTDPLGVGLITAGISVLTAIGTVANGAHSDRTGERVLHTAIPLVVLGFAFVGGAALSAPALILAAIAIVPVCCCATFGPFWSLPTTLYRGRSAAVAFALVSTVSNFGGFLGPIVVGSLKDYTGEYRASFVVLGIFAWISAALALRTRLAGAASRR